MCSSDLHQVDFDIKAAKILKPEVIEAAVEDADDDEETILDALGDLSTSPYALRFEDVHSSDPIYKFATQACISYKLRAEGVTKDSYAMRDAISITLEDDNGGTKVITLSDAAELDSEFSIEEIAEAKSKLPYILKQLHEGSKIMRGSLLSIVIALAKFRKTNGLGHEITPKKLAELGVYRVDDNGRIYSQFLPDDNKNEPYISLQNWARGMKKTDPYWKIAGDLEKVCMVLGIDLTQEDARDYTPEYIEKAVCCYIASNEEFIESYGMIDPKILECIKSGGIYRPLGQGNSETLDNVHTIDKAIEAAALNYNTVIRLRAERDEWEPDINKIKRYLTCVNGLSDSAAEKFIGEHTIIDGILSDNGGTKVVFPHNLANGDQLYTLLGASGVVIRIAMVHFGAVSVYDASDGLHIMDIDNFIRERLGGSLAHGWEVANF